MRPGRKGAADPARELAAATALDRALRCRAAAEVTPIQEGVVLRHQGLFDVHYLNAILLDAAAAPAADAVAALAERWQGGAGHRHIVFNDVAAGEAAARVLTTRGWEQRRTLYMIYDGELAELPNDPRARRIDEAEMDALQAAALREDVPRIDERGDLVARLAATQRALRAANRAVPFGAGEASGLQSMCTLFLGDAGAIIEEVATLATHRRRGLARAVVSAAVRAAVAAGAPMVVVPADADDWPQLMYVSLGFRGVGRQVSLTLRPGSGRPHAGVRSPSPGSG